MGTVESVLVFLAFFVFGMGTWVAYASSFRPLILAAKEKKWSLKFEMGDLFAVMVAVLLPLGVLSLVREPQMTTAQTLLALVMVVVFAFVGVRAASLLNSLGVRGWRRFIYVAVAVPVTVAYGLASGATAVVLLASLFTAPFEAREILAWLGALFVLVETPFALRLMTHWMLTGIHAEPKIRELEEPLQENERSTVPTADRRPGGS